MNKIPFNRVDFTEDEYRYIADAVARGQISGDGYFTAKCEDFLTNIIGAKKCLLTTSCTHALEMTAMLLDIKPGDEILLPSFTFVSTANAYVLRGANLRFVDIREDTLNIDERQTDSLIGEQTKAVIAVHYAGVGCEMSELQRICSNSEAYLIESPILNDKKINFLKLCKS